MIYGSRSKLKPRILRNLCSLIILSTAICIVSAQEKKPEAAPSPPSKSDQQEPPVRIFTEEVVLPVVARDEFGHFDPTIQPEDVLVLEDGVAHEVRSVRRIPVNLVLLLDLGTVFPDKQHLQDTRQIVLRLISRLQPDDRALLIQFTKTAEVLQDWTEDKAKLARAVDREHGILLSRTQSNLAAGLNLTAAKLIGKEIGSAHIVLITDGVDLPDRQYPFIVKRLLRGQPTLDILSYTAISSSVSKGGMTGLAFDPEMKRFRKEYNKTIKLSENRLVALAENFGGRILMPVDSSDALRSGDEIAANLSARCVITYTPKQAINQNDHMTPRHIRVLSRRVGLRVYPLKSLVSRVGL
jgi:hypothetical protein